MTTDITKVILRRLRLIKIDRNLLVFMTFLAISITFWFMQSLKETTNVSLTYQLKIEDVPQNIIFTSPPPTEISVNYSSKGWDAFYHKFMKNENHILTVNFKEADQASTGKILITANQLRRAAQKKQPKEMTYLSTTPSKIEAYYSNGQHKRVPVVFSGKVTTTAGRYLCGTILTPDSVDIYAPATLYEHIHEIQTESISLTQIEDTTDRIIPLHIPHGAKAIPPAVHTRLCVDIFTDKTITVPIYSENVPHSKIMRTFPLKATATFLVSSTHYDEITAQDFLLAVDYRDIKTNDKRCKLHIRQSPPNIRHLRITPEHVEYVIEKENQ